MYIPIGTTNSNPIDIGINTIRRNWARFIEIHLQYPKQDKLASLHMKETFIMIMADKQIVIGKVENVLNTSPKFKICDFTSKEDIGK